MYLTYIEPRLVEDETTRDEDHDVFIRAPRTVEIGDIYIDALLKTRTRVRFVVYRGSIQTTYIDTAGHLSAPTIRPDKSGRIDLREHQKHLDIPQLLVNPEDYSFHDNQEVLDE